MRPIYTVFIILLVLMTSAQCQQSAKDWWFKGSDLFFQGKYDDALQAFDKAIEIDPQFEPAWLSRGGILDVQGKHDEAIQAYDKAIEINPQDVYAWMGKGYLLNEQRKYNDAIQAFDKAIEIDPKDDGSWEGKGLAYEAQGKYDEALQAFDKMIENYPQNALGWHYKGDALGKLGRTTESNEAIAKAKELGYNSSTETPGTTTISPNATTGNHILDHSMASNVDESTSKVITRSNKFLSTDSKVYSWLSLGNVGETTVYWHWYSPDGNLFKTISVDIPPNSSRVNWSSYNVWSYFDIAGNIADLPGNWHVDVYMSGQKLLTEGFSISGGRPTESPETQSFTPAIEKTKAQDWVGQGLALYNQSKYNEAIQAFDKAIEINTQDAKAWYEKGYALDSQGKYNEAIQALDKAIELDPLNADAWYEKGLALEDQGKHDEAQRAYDKAIEIDPLIEDYYG